MDLQALLLQSLRIRHEAFSNFASALSHARSTEEVGKVLAVHIKYLLEVHRLRFFHVYGEELSIYEISRGQLSLPPPDPLAPISVFEERLLEQGIPLYLKEEELTDHTLLQEGLFASSNIKALYALPIKLSEEQLMVLTIGSKVAAPYKDTDFRFVKLIAELTANKLSQISLMATLQSRNNELKEVNEELSVLNEEIRNINLHLEDEVDKRTLELSSANQELSTIFYRTSHDFRSPLTTILGLANLASHHTRDPEILQLFSYCKQAVGQLDRMLNKLKVLSYPADDTVGVQQVKIQELLPSLQQHFVAILEQKSLQWNIEVKEGLILYARQEWVEAILENLLENAFHFSRMDGVVQLRAFSSGTNTIIEVEDEGEGIRSEYLPKVRQMYFKASESATGNGLGLYVCNRLIEKLKGTLELKSTYGKGTLVRVVFPCQ